MTKRKCWPRLSEQLTPVPELEFPPCHLIHMFLQSGFCGKVPFNCRIMSEMFEQGVQCIIIFHKV